MNSPKKSTDLARRSLAAAGWTYIGSFGRLIAQMAIQVALARLLGPHAFGQAMIAMVVLGIGWLVADAGFGSALVQRPHLDDEDVSYALGWTLITSVVIGAVVVGSSPYLAVFLGDSQLSRLLGACGLLVPVQALSNLPTSLMRRQLDMKRLQIIQLSAYVVSYGGLGIGLARLGFGAWSLVGAFALQSIITLLSTYAVVRHTLRPRLKGDAALRAFGLRVMATNVTNWAIDNLDRAVVSRQWGAVALGEYSAASNLSRAPATLLVTSMQSVVFSTASKMQSDPSRLARSFLAVFGLVTLVSMPTFVFLALHAQLVVQTLYGQRWQGAGPLFAAFCLGLPFYAMLVVTGPMLWAVNAVASELKVQIFTATCVVLGMYLLSGLPLVSAIWLIPVLYALRMFLIYTAFASHIKMDHSRTARAIFGGAFFACVSVGVFAIERWVAPQTIVSAVGAALATAALCFFSIRLAPRLVLPPELLALLKSRSSDAGVGRTLCKVMGVAS